MSESEEELSDYRVVLSCIRKRLAGYGLQDALERLERLDDAILQAIVDRAEPAPEPTIN